MLKKLLQKIKINLKEYKADSEWRRILNYFSNAIPIGMTATLKETKEVSSSTYFGEPIYTYSLNQGIMDGFLAPFKIIRVNIDRDIDGWRPHINQRNVDGNLITDKIFHQQDFDDTLFIEGCTKVQNLLPKESLLGLKKMDDSARPLFFK